MRKLFILIVLLGFVGTAQTGIGTTTPAVKLHVKSNGSIFRLEGTDHAYMEWYPQGASTRFGWLGYPSAAAIDLTLSSQYATGSLVFNTNNTERFRINASGNVGIGTNAPSSTLTVGNTTGSVSGELTLNPAFTANEGGQINIRKSVNGSTADWVIDQYGTTASDARFRIFNSIGESNGITILENGNVGMGVLTPSVRLQVAGDIIANSIAGSSDVRFKTHITPIENPLQKVLQLRGVHFDWNTKDFPDRKFSDQKAIGFIAQEVEKVLPEVVQTEKTPEGYKAVQYDKVVALLVEAIKEQQKQIDRLKLELKKKKNK
ncbi:MAG: hypothetical protein RLZZ236_1406 [Bacteroidota bacterium]|jgi:hypothetical protein